MRNSRIIITMGLVLALLLGATAGVFAQTADPEAKPEGKPGAVRGVVVSKAARSFEIRKADGDRMNILVDDQTRFRLVGHPDMKFKDLQRGDTVTVLGRRDKTGDLVAKLVNIAPRKPKILRMAGTVTEIDKDSVTIRTLSGPSATLIINDKTRFVPQDAKPKKGDHVAVVGVRAWGQQDIVAKLIAMKGELPEKS